MYFYMVPLRKKVACIEVLVLILNSKIKLCIGITTLNFRVNIQNVYNKFFLGYGKSTCLLSGI